jgi:hypothetical protein
VGGTVAKGFLSPWNNLLECCIQNWFPLQQLFLLLTILHTVIIENGQTLSFCGGFVVSIHLVEVPVVLAFCRSLHHSFALLKTRFVASLFLFESGSLDPACGQQITHRSAKYETKRS